jgi:hypothetical protein
LGFGKGTTSGSAIYYYGARDKAGSYESGWYGIEGADIGIFRSDDDGATWTQIDDGLHNYGGVNYLVGDPCIYSRIYLGTKGRGMVYAEDGTNENTCSDRVENGTPSEPVEPPTPILAGPAGSLNPANPDSDKMYFDMRGNQVGASLVGAPTGVYIVRQGSSVKRIVKF